jgi:hypothetical protein
MRKFFVLAALALAVPSLALAAKPPSPGNSQGPHGKSAPKVMYVLKGTLTALSSSSVTITVAHTNHHAKTLVTNPATSVTIAVSSTTKVVMHDGAAFASGDRGVVKVRLPKNTTGADLLTALANPATVAVQVIDQGPAS